MLDPLETVQPAGIMHYGAAFTQKKHVNDEGGDGGRGGGQMVLMVGFEEGGVRVR